MKYTSIQTWISSNPSEKEVNLLKYSIGHTGFNFSHMVSPNPIFDELIRSLAIKEWVN